jgi:hypothetical protein
MTAQINSSPKDEFVKPSNWLLDYGKNVYSQTGEDGVIEKILDILPDRDSWCVEFGAWDGVHLSNTCNLIENQNYSAVLIEGSSSKFNDLKARFAQNPKIIPVNRFVGWESSDNLDSILADTPIPTDFDFLSIDVDGNDYHIWNAVKVYRPKLICIEFNPTIPTEVDFIQPANPKISQGSSLLALVKLAQSKGYELICCLRQNGFFIKSEYFNLFEIHDNSPFTLRTDLSLLTYLFCGYDGQIFLRGSRKLPWHGCRLKEEKMQVIPKVFRQYNGGSLNVLFKIYRSLLGLDLRG